MERIEASTVSRQFKRTFDEAALNALGKRTRFCQREREVTPFRLALSLIEAFAIQVDSLADIQRTFNALCETDVQYKPFHNQLAKREFPVFMRRILDRLLESLACDVLRFTPQSPFARFRHIRIQDGTSFAVKSTLADTFPGRFTTVSPAAVELHCELDLLREQARVALSPDSAPERAFLPEPTTLTGDLFLADRGYFSRAYLSALDRAGASFIVRAKTDCNPLILKVSGPDGREIKALRNRRLRQVKHRLSKYDCLDMSVRFDSRGEPFTTRLIVHPNLCRDDVPRYLVTNLAAGVFSAAQVSDAYRLRWQIELLFKEWKSFANLKAFGTSNPHIAEGLIWASLCAAAVKRYWAHMTQFIARVAISTRIVAMCIHHVLRDVLYDLLHRHRALSYSVQRAIDYLSGNAQRAHPKRDRKSGRLKLGLEHVYGCA